MQINYYSNITHPTVLTVIPPSQWLDKIKGSEYSETITQARNGSLPYENTKSSLPCVTYNFLFNGYKKTENILSPTGLMYIDIDTPEFDLKILDTSKIYSYYKSFGGVGYAIIVKVDGLSQDNFKSSYLSICKELGIFEFIDVQAIKPTQFNVLSYDENIFINETPYVFTSTLNSPHSIVIGKKKRTYTIEGGEIYHAIRFNNLDEVDVTGDYTVNWDGIQWVNCFIPIKKIDTRRNSFLLSYTNNLVWLNPKIAKKRTLRILSNINKIAFRMPVPESQLNRVVNTIFKYKLDGTLKPIYNRKSRKIVFRQSVKMNKDEKLAVCRHEIGKRAASKSRKKISDIIESWDFKKLGKITQPKIYKSNPISSKTVEKYWSEFKERIKELNISTNLKQNMTALNNLLIILMNTPYLLTLSQLKYLFYR